MGMSTVGMIAGAVVVSAAGALGALQSRYIRGRREVDREWNASTVAPLPDIGSTASLEILPLVDWATANPQLQGEAGVSMLIRTDHNTILFDVGLNQQRRDPSPLLANMKQLGVSLDDIDTIVLSHNHLDHVGGLPWLRRGSFSLGNRQLDLSGKRVFVPVALTYPGVAPTVSHDPTPLGPGVATTGTIAGQLYMGRVEEQAVAIRVHGKGTVLVVGCGHQGMTRLLARAARLFDEPLYGLIGGLHYPVPRGRLTTAGIDIQRLVVFGPFQGPSQADVDSDIGLLAQRNPAWVSLSAHDSSDESIASFRAAFGPNYRELKVGEWQRVAPRAPHAAA